MELQLLQDQGLVRSPTTCRSCRGVAYRQEGTAGLVMGVDGTKGQPLPQTLFPLAYPLYVGV